MVPTDPSGRRATFPTTVRRVRRALLRRRRWIAAGLAGVAVLAGVAAAVPPAPTTVGVAIAARPLPPGTVLAESDLRLVQQPADLAPAGRVDVGTLVGRALAGPVGTHEPVTEARLVGPTALTPEPGEVTVPVRLPDAGVVALLTVGERVDVLATDAESGTTRTAARDVRVVAIPPEGDGGDTGGVGAAGLGGRLVVVAAPRETAVTLAGAAVHHFLTIAFTG